MTPENAPPPSLAELIELDVQPRRVWRVDELGAILLHELSLPLSIGLSQMTLTAAEPAADPRDASEMRLLTLGTLLHHPQPPLEMLERVKDAAKAARHDPQSHLPEDVAAVLYGMAIAAALLRHGRRITSMSDWAARNYLEWACGREWLDAASRRLLSGALSGLSRDLAH